MEIRNPRRILALSLSQSKETLSAFMRDLTGSAPEPAGTPPTLVGTTHQLTLKTAYYSASVPVWLDLTSDPAEWAEQFAAEEARPVLKALGGFAVVFALPSASERLSAGEGESERSGVNALITEAGRVYREQLGGWGWDGVALVVGVGDVAGPEELEVWEDVCGEGEMEFVHIGNVGGRISQSQVVGSKVVDEERNQFGEKIGMQRVLEALESNDWAAVSDGLDEWEDEPDDEDGFGAWETAKPRHEADDRISGLDAGGSDDEGEMFDPQELEFGFDNADFKGLRKAIWSAGRDEEEEDMIDKMAQGRDVEQTTPARAGVQAEAAQAQAPPPVAVRQSVLADDPPDHDEPDEEEVQRLDVMMRKLLAVRDMSAGLPEEQRRRMAARAVGEVMKEL